MLLRPILFVLVQVNDVLQLFASTLPPPSLVSLANKAKTTEDIPIIMQNENGLERKGKQSNPAWQGNLLNIASYKFVDIDELKRFHKNVGCIEIKLILTNKLIHACKLSCTVLLHTVTAFMFQDENDIHEVTFMQQRDPTAFIFQLYHSVPVMPAAAAGRKCLAAPRYATGTMAGILGQVLGVPRRSASMIFI